jgi:hypothetical protein
MDVTYFRPRRPGPEVVIENAVAQRIPELFPNETYPLWTAGSVPIGAGMPDLVVVACEPQVFALTKVEIPTAHILAYLRAVGRARLETIASRMRRPTEVIVRCLNGLVEVEAVSSHSATFSLVPTWRDILPEIVTIEAKVSNWQKAVEQANRNRIFAHSSFVALPERVAHRVKSEEIFRKLGIGLLSVNEHHEVEMVRRARRNHPRVWAYYYYLAALVASHSKGLNHAFHSSDNSSSSRLS